MGDFLNKINDWSEVWSLLLPLTILLIYRPHDPSTRYLRIYLYLAFILNLIATILYVFHKHMPPSLSNNNIFYNLHSLGRVVLFSLFMFTIHPKLNWLYKPAFFTYLALVLINFTFFESPLFISSRHFAAEGIIMMLFCIVFILSAIQDDSNINWLKQPSFLVWTGIGLYEAITIFIFLFFYPLYTTDREFGVLTMTIRKMTFVIFCILIAIALYISSTTRSKEKIIEK
jgi:hypothetical protein